MNNKRLDKTFHEKVNHVQQHNGINVFWDKEGVWKKIQQALADSTKGPKMIAWYMATAASISLLVASSVSMLEFSLPFSEEKVDLGSKVSVNLEVKENSRTAKSHFYLPSDSMTIPLRSRQVGLVSQEANPKLVESLPRTEAALHSSNLSVRQGKLSKSNHARLLNFQVSGGISANQKFITPRIDVGVSLNLSKKAGVSQKLLLASSVQFMQKVGVENKTSNGFSTGYFVKTAYESEKMKNGKLRGWSTGAEYMIHSEDDSLPADMLKIFYTRTLLKKLKVGPEILFTNKFRRIYPGITLAFG